MSFRMVGPVVLVFLLLPSLLLAAESEGEERSPADPNRGSEFSQSEEAPLPIGGSGVAGWGSEEFARPFTREVESRIQRIKARRRPPPLGLKRTWHRRPNSEPAVEDGLLEIDLWRNNGSLKEMRNPHSTAETVDSEFSSGSSPSFCNSSTPAGSFLSVLSEYTPEGSINGRWRSVPRVSCVLRRFCKANRYTLGVAIIASILGVVEYKYSPLRRALKKTWSLIKNQVLIKKLLRAC